MIISTQTFTIQGSRYDNWWSTNGWEFPPITGDAAPAVTVVAGGMQYLDGQFVVNYGGQAGTIDPTIQTIGVGV